MPTMRAVVQSSLVVCAVLLLLSAGLASAEGELKLAGFVDLPGTGGTLTLPLPPGTAPVTIQITFGIPSVSVPVEITRATHVEFDAGLPITLTDGDRVEVEAVVANGVIRAVRLDVDEFPELELKGRAKGLPAAGVTLPLGAGTTVDFMVTLGSSGVDVPVRLTDKTKVRGGPFTLDNGDPVRVEAGVQNNAIVATEIRR